MSDEERRWQQQLQAANELGERLAQALREGAHLPDRRERIATAVLAGLGFRSSESFHGGPRIGWSYATYAEEAVRRTDALIAALDKPRKS